MWGFPIQVGVRFLVWGFIPQCELWGDEVSWGKNKQKKSTLWQKLRENERIRDTFNKIVGTPKLIFQQYYFEGLILN